MPFFDLFASFVVAAPIFLFVFVSDFDILFIAFDIDSFTLLYRFITELVSDDVLGISISGIVGTGTFTSVNSAMIL